MNYLAHLVLAAHDDALLVGGFLGDFVKGPLNGNFPADIESGIRLHRRIDATSDRDPDFQQSVMLFPEEIRRFAPPLVDIIADHILARNFQTLSGLNSSRTQFAEQALDILTRHEHTLPIDAQTFLQRLHEYDVLNAYQYPETIMRIAKRIQERFIERQQRRRKSGSNAVPDLLPAVAQVLQQTSTLEEHFAIYFPRLQAVSADWNA